MLGIGRGAESPRNTDEDRGEVSERCFDRINRIYGIEDGGSQNQEYLTTKHTEHTKKELEKIFRKPIRSICIFRPFVCWVCFVVKNLNLFEVPDV